MNFDLNLSPDQQQILEAAAEMLRRSYPICRRHAEAPENLAEAASFGAFGLALSEAEGGVGFTLVEEALTHVLFGRHIMSPSSIAMTIGARLARSAGRLDLASRIVAGEVLVCAGVRLEDELLLFDRDKAAHAVIFSGRSLELVRVDASSLSASPGLGGTGTAATVPAAGCGSIGQSNSPLLVAIADLLVSAQLLGVAEAVCELAVAYAQVRHQFGQPIGGFQAIKHHCANMAVRAEMLSSQLDIAAIALRDGDDDAAFQIAALRRLAPEIALANARIAIQVHGGIGFSADANVHLFLKHAHTLSWLGRAEEMLGLPAPLAPLAANLERN